VRDVGVERDNVPRVGTEGHLPEAGVGHATGLIPDEAAAWVGMRHAWYDGQRRQHGGAEQASKATGTRGDRHVQCSLRGRAPRDPMSPPYQGGTSASLRERADLL